MVILEAVKAIGVAGRGSRLGTEGLIITALVQTVVVAGSAGYQYLLGYNAVALLTCSIYSKPHWLSSTIYGSAQAGHHALVCHNLCRKFHDVVVNVLEGVNVKNFYHTFART